MSTIAQPHRQIWHTVNLIPAGKVASYGMVADLAGLPGRARLVGKSLSLAPTALLLPWHRVLRATGQLAFPPGSSNALEQTGRLQQEGVVVVNNRVKMQQFRWQPTPADILFMLDY